MEVIDEAKLREFAERGYLLLRGVVPRDLIDDASRSIDNLIAQQPPPMGVQGNYFPRVTNVKTFLPLLLRSSAFALAESLVGVGHNIGCNISSVTRRAVYFRLKRDDHVAHWRTSLQEAWRDFDVVRAYLEDDGSKSKNK